METVTTTKTMQALRTIITHWGFPEQLVSDNGPQFTSEEFKQFCRLNGIKHVLVAPYHPRSNGEAERFVMTFKPFLCHDGGGLVEEARSVLVFISEHSSYHDGLLTSPLVIRLTVAE